jgi:hypothetical protein
MLRVGATEEGEEGEEEEEDKLQYNETLKFNTANTKAWHWT